MFQHIIKSKIRKMKNLTSILQELLTETESDAVILANSDGLPLEAINTTDDNRVAALTASLQSMTDRFVENFDRGEADQVIIEARDSYIIIKRVNENLQLMLLSGKNSKLGMLLLYLDNAISRINKVFA